MSTVPYVVTLNPDQARRWLTKKIQVDGQAINRAKHLGIRKTYKADGRDTIELWLARLMDELGNNQHPAVWCVYSASAVEVYPMPKQWEGGALVVVKAPGLRLVSPWMEFGEFAHGPEMPGVDAAIQALIATADMANHLVRQLEPPQVRVQEAALREWLTTHAKVLVHAGWEPLPTAVALLVGRLNDDLSGVGRAAWHAPHLVNVTYRKVGWDIEFVGDLRGGGRIITRQCQREDLAERRGVVGVDAAVYAVQQVARFLNDAMPQQFGATLPRAEWKHATD